MRRLALAGLVLLAAACGRTASAGGGDDTLTITTSEGDVRVRVEVADDEDERVRGLSGRESLAADGGMVFLFDEPVTTRFWMKDTTIPLSIAFWGPDGRILALLDMPTCHEDDCPTYGPDRPYVGALEVNRGFFERHGVEEGDRVAL